jgi:hypothetical protein
VLGEAGLAARLEEEGVPCTPSPAHAVGKGPDRGLTFFAGGFITQR